MDDPRAEIEAVLRELRTLMARPDNNFAWSPWEDAGPALKKIDRMIGLLEKGWFPSRPTVATLFQPIGPVQEVSLSSGWGNEFVTLGSRFDAAADVFYTRGPWWRRLLG